MEGVGGKSEKLGVLGRCSHGAPPTNRSSPGRGCVRLRQEALNSAAIGHDTNTSGGNGY